MPTGAGILIVNADDWGADALTTDRTLDCIRCGSVSSVSAMVFMEDSERAARIAREQQLDAGLHLNFTTPFSAAAVNGQLREQQSQICRFLRSNAFAQVLFHPGLIRSFEYVTAVQREEFCRLYGTEPQRYDGHHHMHLCANVLWQRLLPPGTAVRRNFTFQVGEKSAWNRLYRSGIDRVLSRRHMVTDAYFSLSFDSPSWMERVLALAARRCVELGVHPSRPDEHAFLTTGGLFRSGVDFAFARCYAVASREAQGVPTKTSQ
jgi:predicted glycoside hydrolase/deacetylase ChbG (UPF0249 family)